MQATETRPASAHPVTPAWLWAALLAGAVVTVWWAWFVAGFLHEPSAVGRVLAALVTSIVISSVSGLAGAAGAIGLLRNDSWGRPLAWVAAVALTLSVVGAIGGIPALIGLGWSRETKSEPNLPPTIRGDG